MFKGILPSKRISSSEFTMVTSFGDSVLNGKENLPDAVPAPHTKQSKGQKGTSKHTQSKSTAKTMMQKQIEPEAMNQAFDRLLDDLQIPSTLRPKLANMDSTVKAAMLKSSHVITNKPPVSPPHTPRTVRKAHSSESLSSPYSSNAAHNFLRPPVTAGFVSGSALASQASASTYALNAPPSGHGRGSSMDVYGTHSRGQVPPGVSGDLVVGKSKEKSSSKSITPVKFCSIMTGTSSTQLDIEIVKKLRLMLRNESANWSQEFLRLGGYNAMLTRLNEILEVEWREEQHDDQILHELLRCFKALSTSSIGCFALRSSSPTPFVQLVALLYSDKKPGDVATRQLIVDLLLILFDLYPSSSLPSTGGKVRREAWQSETSETSPSNLVTLPSPHKTFYSLIRALLLTPAPPPTESPAAPISPHAFIESLHRPRIYKTYLQELSDICRDYFWVFCHPNNTVWHLADADEDKVEKPRAPGGMTGGVEFEAMNYFTTHLKLVNAIAKAARDLNLPKDHEMSAYRFHADLFASGLERILLIARKASTAYYPTLHLELARYVMLVGQAKHDLPWTISRLIGPPPTALCKSGRGQSAHNSPTKRGAPGFIGIPPPQKVEPLKFD